MDKSNVLDVNVSRFESYTQPNNSKEVNLYKWLNDNSQASDVKYIRGMKDKKERDALKALLPAITPSGVFSKRSSEALVKHSGLICLDIDYKDNVHYKNFFHLKEEMSLISNVAYCGLSVSAQGYFVLIPIAYPDKHEQHFDALKKQFAEMGIVVDKQCRDVARLRGYSVDKKPYFNLEAVPYKKLLVPQKRKPFFYNFFCGEDNKLERLVREICRQHIDITSGYEHWRNVGFALAHELGEGGRSMFHAVSSQYEKYHEKECDRQYTLSLKRTDKGITIATFYYYCKCAGLDVSTGKACKQ